MGKQVIDYREKRPEGYEGRWPKNFGHAMKLHQEAAERKKQAEDK